MKSHLLNFVCDWLIHLETKYETFAFWHRFVFLVHLTKLLWSLDVRCQQLLQWTSPKLLAGFWPNLEGMILILVCHPEPEKKNLLVFLSTFWHPCSKCILMCFNKDRGGCQVWKCPKVPELGQRSTECKFLYIHLILAFLSICYPKLWLKVIQNLFWIIQPCYINKQHHQGMMCVWIKGHLSAKSVKIVSIFYVYMGKIQILSSLLP